jgi:hypothetical protein
MRAILWSLGLGMAVAAGGGSLIRSAEAQGFDAFGRPYRLHPGGYFVPHDYSISIPYNYQYRYGYRLNGYNPRSYHYQSYYFGQPYYWNYGYPRGGYSYQYNW